MIQQLKGLLFPQKRDPMKERFPTSEVAPSVWVSDATVLEGHNCIYDRVVLEDSSVGLATYIGADSKFPRCKIGRFCSISWNVEVIAGRHPKDMASLHPAFYSPRNFAGLQLCQEEWFAQYRYATPGYYVEIGNDVLIAAHALLLDGIRIGDGAIILAGATVTKDVAPYTIVGGSPAQVMGTRFSPEIIDLLLEFKWWDRDLSWMREHISDFQDMDRFLSLIKGETK